MLKQIRMVLSVAGIRYGRYFVLYTGLAAVVAVCQVYANSLTGQIGQAAVQGRLQEIYGFLAAMAVITGVRLLLEPFSVWLAKRFAANTEYGLRREFARHYAAVPYREVEEKGSGLILSLYTADLPQAYTLAAVNSLQLIFELATALAGMVFLFILQPLIALAFIAMVPLLALAQVKISAPIEKNAREASKKRAEFTAVVNDSLQNTATVAAYSMEQRMEQRYLERYREYFMVEMKRIRVFCRLVISGLIASILPIVFAGLACALSVIAGGMSLAGFVAFLAIGGMVNSWLGMLSQRLSDVRRNAAGAKRLLAQGTGQEEAGQGGCLALAPAEEVFALKDLGFSYDGQKNVLDKLSLRVMQGEKIAIVGESGCGKSTLLKLMLSLHSGYSGSLRLYGRELSALAVNALREHIAYVPQDNYLFAGTVAENIACLPPNGCAEGRALEEACRRAGIWEFVKALPQGPDTPVEEGGENLSGGQRQRLALARAFYKNSGVYLLDEATSALDPATEQMVLDGFTGALQGQTAIVVAHRLAAVKNCGRILVMDKGKIAEEGTMEELLAKNGLFARMYAREKEGGGNG